MDPDVATRAPLLDHTIIWNERQLRRREFSATLADEFLTPHRGLDP